MARKDGQDMRLENKATSGWGVPAGLARGRGLDLNKRQEKPLEGFPQVSGCLGAAF